MKAADKQARGYVAFDRMAEELALRGGCTIEHGRKLLGVVYDLVKAEIEAGRYVIPGVLVVVRRDCPAPNRNQYRASVVIDRNKRLARWIKERRNAKRTPAAG